MSKFKRVLSDSELIDVYRSLDNPKHDRDSVIEAMGAAVDAAMGKLAEQEPLTCDYCRKETNDPWHGSGLLNGVESKHIHACDGCRHLLPHPTSCQPHMGNKTACVTENGESDTQHHLSYLKRYQKWRRGEDKTMDEAGLTPKQIGETLDWLIGVVEDHIPDGGQMIPEYAEVYVGDGLFSICDWQDWDSIKGYKWSLSTRDRSGCLYAQTKVDNGDGTRSRLAMHHAILPQKNGFVIDHINGNGLDNRRCNLRYATVQQNSFNQKTRKASSIYKGVSLDKESGSWRATIGVNGKKIYGGRHETELEAAKAYDKMAKKHFGEFAVLNLA